MKRLLCLLLAALTVLLCACTPKPAQYDVRRDLHVYFANADAVIDAVREALVRRDLQIGVTYYSESEHMEDVSELVRDLMQYVYAETDSPAEGDYLYQQCGGYELAYSHIAEESRWRYELTLTPALYTDPAQEAAVDARVQEIVQTLGLRSLRSDYEKICAVCGYVAEHVTYDKVHAKNPHYHLKTTCYAALCQGTAVCQGYAVAVYRLLREAGVGVRVITGLGAQYGGTPEPHAWNIVCIEGLWYNVDVTWGSGTPGDPCFLRSDADFAGHQRDAAYLGDAFLSQYPMSAQSR